MPTAIITAGAQTLVSKGSNYRLYIPTGSLTATVEFALAVGGGCGATQSANSIAGLVQNQWNHVVGTYDGQDLRIYTNGEEQGRTHVIGSACANSNSLLVGGQGGGNAFIGRLDEVAVYDHALTASEVRDMFLYPGQAG